MDPNKKTRNCDAESPIYSTHFTAGGRELSACFAGTAKVLTPSGGMCIRDLVVGEHILAYDSRGMLRTRDIVERKIHENISVFNERSNKPIRVSADHAYSGLI